jgi:hypothetical protein
VPEAVHPAVLSGGAGETNDPALRGEMKVTITLRDAEGGTEVVGMHEGVPDGVSIADNELGWRNGARQPRAARRGMTSR